MDEYRGFQEIKCDDPRLNDFYGNLSENIFNCLQNEYVLIYDAYGNAKDFYRWDGSAYIPVGKLRLIFNGRSSEFLSAGIKKP